MPASFGQNDRFHAFERKRNRFVSGLSGVLLWGLLTTAVTAAYDPWSEPRPSYDPFEEEASPASAAAASTAPTMSATPATKPAESELHILPATLPPPDDKDDRADSAPHFGTRLAKLVNEEPLPGLPPAAPADQTAADNWLPKPLGEMSINIRLPNGMLPRNYWAEHPQPLPLCDVCGTNRGWPLDCYHWCPTCLCYQPLYFEEPNLERYGYGCGCYTCCCSTCIQSAASAAHFFGTVPSLPYMMAANCPCECNYALGDYRPGDCVPWRYQCCAPCSAAGSFSEGAAAYGMILMLP
jgi:hypothetical protein